MYLTKETYRDMIHFNIDQFRKVMLAAGCSEAYRDEFIQEMREIADQAANVLDEWNQFEV